MRHWATDPDAPLVPVSRFWSDQTWAPKSASFCTPCAHWIKEGEVATRVFACVPAS